MNNLIISKLFPNMIIFTLLLILTTFIFMEIVSWIIHKYFMNHILREFYKIHHKPAFLKIIALFILLLGGIATSLIYFGSELTDYRFWVGTGISICGIAYFILHDNIIHKQLSIFKNIKINFFIDIGKAYRDHSKSKGRNSNCSLGLLLISDKYIKNHIPGGDL